MAIFTVPLTTASGIRDIFITQGNKYAVVVTTSGVEFVDLLRGRVTSSGIIPGGYAPLCAAADWVTSSGLLYVGTSGGGVFSTPYIVAREPGSDFSGSLVAHFSTGSAIPISGDVIFDLDARPSSLLVATSGGLDFVSNLSDSATRSVPGGVPRARLAVNGNVAYWLTASSLAVNYDLISELGGGIIGSDYEYTSSSTPALPSPNPLDLSIAEGSPRTIAVATPSGLLIIQEMPGSEFSAPTKNFLAPNDFVEFPEPYFVSADFGPNATYISGQIFATTTGTGYALAMADGSILRHNPQDLTNTVQTLTQGQAVASGIQSLIRTTNVAF